MVQDVTVRNMRSEEMAHAMEMADDEGWNPGISDGDVFYRSHGQDFMVAVDGEEVLGTVSSVRYEDYAFLGFYLVRPEHRGHGVGSALYREAIRHAEGLPMVFDGVMDMVPTYRRDGFIEAFHSVRYSLGAFPRPSGLTVPLVEVDRDLLHQYDGKVFMSRRYAFLDAWVEAYGGRAIVDDRGIRGYAVVRSCEHGHKVGPLFAEDRGTAESLLGDMLEGVEGEVFIDVPLCNRPGTSMVRSLGGRETFRCARMFKHSLPAFPTDRIFGITSFELG